MTKDLGSKKGSRIFVTLVWAIASMENHYTKCQYRDMSYIM